MIVNTHSRYCKKVRLLLVLCAVIPGSSTAQQNSESSEAAHRKIRGSAEAIAPWLLNSDDGLAIIGAALESRHTDSNADCSNLVHAIYERAGFTYAYANSSELYGGIKAFRQVIHPQPGDLVVWRGHVGIVISPAQHSFFSAMRSGRGVEYYDSPYWEARGRPRFFRYLRAARPTLFSVSTRSGTLQASSSGSAESHDPVPADEDFGSTPGVSSARPATSASMLGPTVDQPTAAPSNHTLSRPRVNRMTPPAALSEVEKTQAASLQNSEIQREHDAQIPTRTDHQVAGLAADGPENAGTGRTPGRLFGSVPTAAPRYVPRPPRGFWASSTAARNRSSHEEKSSSSVGYRTDIHNDTCKLRQPLCPARRETR